MKLQYDPTKDLHYTISTVRGQKTTFYISKSGVESLEAVKVSLGATIKQELLVQLTLEGKAWAQEIQIPSTDQLEMDFNLDQGEFDYLPRCEETDSVYEVSFVILKKKSEITAHLYSPEPVVIHRSSAIVIIPLFALTFETLNRIQQLHGISNTNQAVSRIRKWYQQQNAARWEVYTKERSKKQAFLDLDIDRFL
jgi:hypothetical protein